MARRMLPTCVVSILWVATVVVPAQLSAAPAADPPAARQAQAPGADLTPEQLLQSLSHADWHARRDAVRQLIALGPQADAMLRDLLRRDLDNEQRKNVGLALQLIDDNRRFGASPITLHMKDAPVADVMAEIERQCQATLPTYPASLFKQDGWGKLTINADRAPFWEVMRELGNRLNIDYLSDAQEVRITRGPARLPAGTISSGAFLLTARAEAMRRGMTLELSVYPEPKLNVLRTIDLKLDRAVDDQGNPLTPMTGRGGFRGGRGFGRFGMPTRTPNGPRQVSGVFQRPGDSDKIAELRGQVTVSVAGATTLWEVKEPLNAAPVTRTIDGIPVTIEALAAAGDGYVLRTTIPFAWSGNDVQQNEIKDLMRRGLRLLDARGRALSAGTPDNSPGGSGSTDITVIFSPGAAGAGNKTGPPAKLVWEVPDSIRDLVVPFNFKAIPIYDPYN